MSIPFFVRRSVDYFLLCAVAVFSLMMIIVIIRLIVVILTATNNHNNDDDNLIIMTLKSVALSFTIDCLRRSLTSTCMLTWERNNTRNTYGTAATRYRHITHRINSVTVLYGLEIAFKFICYLSGEEGGETRVPGENPSRRDEKCHVLKSEYSLLDPIQTHLGRSFRECVQHASVLKMGTSFKSAKKFK